MLAPELGYVLHTGERGPLSRLYSEQPLVLVFLRHLGCVFCREHVATLNRSTLNIALVVMASPTAANAFREEMQSPHPFLCDESHELYDAFGLKRGNLTQLFNLHTIRRGMEATRAGHRVGKPVGDPWVLGGTFVVSTDGKIVFSKPAHDASDNATEAEILAALRAHVA